MPRAEYDVVIVGAGHNGLVAGNYLADAGLKVIVVEAAAKVGGMTTTEVGAIPEAPQHKTNPCAVDPIWWEAFPASRDLDLGRYGLRFKPLDPCYAYLHPDGDSIAFWRDPRRTAEEISHFSKPDAAAYLDFVRFLDGFYELTSPLANTSPTKPGLGAVGQASKAALKHRKQLGAYGAFYLSSGAEVINEWFEHPMVRNGLHVMSGAFYPSTMAGSTFLLIAVPMFHRIDTGRPIGGTGAITEALAKRLAAAGGTIRTSSPVREIIVSKNRATGVCLTDGTVLEAGRAVLATCDPVTALTRLLPPGTLPSKLEGRTKAIPTFSGGAGVVKVDVALNGQLDLSKYNKKRRDGLDMRLPSHFIGHEEGLQRAYARCAAGLLPDPTDFGAWNCIPTAHDPSQAPEGQDTLYIWSSLAPVSPDEGWDNVKDKMGQIAIDSAALHYSGIADFELGRLVQTHEDIARKKWCEGTRGGVMHVDHVLSRTGPLRPALGLAGYTTPVGGLYLGGAGSHPGGGVTGAPGHNSAKEILRGLRKETSPRRIRNRRSV
ncbi:MAG TPA: NAD(P)/FAD-dependent oxidoreductase [Acidimicrobiia bacterium]|nr:NAD(P)/FAD-dependent oxidoreductase [Acidimicrobiia bacterium]